MYDLIVIGGGPAGTSAAITAARSGAQVLLLERGRFPRHKVCGEFVSAESLHVLAELLDPREQILLNEAERISSTRIFIEDRELHTTIEPAAASIARLELDAALWDSAKRCGVEAKQQVSVQSIRGSGPFLVGTSSEGLESRAVINASGRWSNLAQPPSNGEAKSRWIGLKGHFAESNRPTSVDLYFFDGGYCGVQPVDLADDRDHKRINACAMVRADVASTLPEVFALHPALQERARHWQPLSEPVSTAPLLFRKPVPERAGTLMAGDAAGFVDPFVGDGISLALRSGRSAAQCLLPFFAGTSSLEDARKKYVADYESEFARVFRMASRIRRAVEWPRIIRTPILAALEKAPAVTQYLVRKTR